MPRINVFLSEAANKRLTEYIGKHFGAHNVRSGIIQRAVNEYLDREMPELREANTDLLIVGREKEVLQ